jgi:hypothetical protein
MDLSASVQWYEAFWTFFMLLAFGANGFAAIQALADRAAARRTAKATGRPWTLDGNPARSLSAMQVRNAFAPLAIVVPGLVFGVLLMTSVPMPTPPGAQRILGIPRNGFALTIFFLALAGILAVWPIFNLWDTRRLYAMAGLFERAPAWRRRKETVGNALALAGLLLALAVTAYAGALYQDLMVQSGLPGGLPLTLPRYLGQLCRALLSQVVTGLWAALAMGAIVGAFYRLRGPLDRPVRQGGIPDD